MAVAIFFEHIRLLSAKKWLEIGNIINIQCWKNGVDGSFLLVHF